MLHQLAKASPIAIAALALAGCETIAEPVAESLSPTYTAALTGAAEVGAAGDPDGSGTAEISLVDEVVNQVCYEIAVTGISPATAAHIHSGAAGVAGPPVVTLEAPTSGEVSGCASADDDTIDAIRANPAAFYVNVHTADFPGGAIRGQLRR